MPVSENPAYKDNYEEECQRFFFLPIDIFVGTDFVRYLPNDSDMKARYISFLMSKVDQADKIINKIIDNPRSLTSFMYAYDIENVKQKFIQMLSLLE